MPYVFSQVMSSVALICSSPQNAAYRILLQGCEKGGFVLRFAGTTFPGMQEHCHPLDRRCGTQECQLDGYDIGSKDDLNRNGSAGRSRLHKDWTDEEKRPTGGDPAESSGKSPVYAMDGIERPRAWTNSTCVPWHPAFSSRLWSDMFLARIRFPRRLRSSQRRHLARPYVVDFTIRGFSATIARTARAIHA
jgi:hypothetical protein